MTLSEELAWRGFSNQTTYKAATVLDGELVTFYWGVDPSADSMHVGQLAMAMMIRHFIDHGHKAILLVGGATGLIGDPDGKKKERDLKTVDEIDHNKQAIAAQYKQLFPGNGFDVVDNYDWFKGMGYLQFLRDVGKHVPMRQMLGREFVQSRLGEGGTGISYAEFSYSLIQGYDFLHLYRTLGATLQVCGADQWGNSIAGVELIRRIEGVEANVWSAPLIIDRASGKKFGKSEGNAVWLDTAKTTPTQFYQFWMNVDDEGVEDYLKIYTLLFPDEINQTIAKHKQNARLRHAQQTLAEQVTELVHGNQAMKTAQRVSELLVGKTTIGDASEEEVNELRKEIPAASAVASGSVIDALVASGLVASTSEARRLLRANAITLNGVKINREEFTGADFQEGRLLLQRGKKFSDKALIELAF